MTNTGMPLRSSSGSSRHRHGSFGRRDVRSQCGGPSTIPITSPIVVHKLPLGVLVWPPARRAMTISRRSSPRRPSSPYRRSRSKATPMAGAASRFPRPTPRKFAGPVRAPADRRRQSATTCPRRRRRKKFQIAPFLHNSMAPGTTPQHGERWCRSWKRAAIWHEALDLPGTGERTPSCRSLVPASSTRRQSVRHGNLRPIPRPSSSNRACGHFPWFMR